jgi:hypothetical protein
MEEEIALVILILLSLTFGTCLVCRVFFDNSLDITEPTKEFDRSETGPEVVPQPSKDSKDSSHDAKSSKKERTKRSSDKKKPAIPEDHYTTDEEEHPVSRGKSRSKKSAQSGSKKAEIARHHKRESSDSDHSLQRRWVQCFTIDSMICFLLIGVYF